MIRLGDGAGRTFEARIEGVGPSKVSVTVTSETWTPPPSPRLTVLQGLGKGAKADFVVEKLVELGVDEVVVFHAGRSVPVWNEDKRRKMAQRYKAVALAAAKQSHRAWLPEVIGPVGRSEAVRLCEGRPFCFLSDPSGEVSLRESLPLEAPPSAALIVGPEGGLEETEIEEFVVSGAVRVRLGPQVLRTETAGLVIASVVMFHLGRLD